VILVRLISLFAASTVLVVLAIAPQGARSGAAQPQAMAGTPVECGTMVPSHPRTGEPVRVAAELSGDEATLTGTYGGTFPTEISRATLAIRDDGRLVFSGRVGVGPYFFKNSVALGSLPVYTDSANAPQGSLCIVRLASGERPSVLLDLYSGGAHCCTFLDGYRFGSDRLQLTSLDIGNPLAQLAYEGGKFVILTADNSFAYAFSSFAGSGMPIKVLSFSGDAFTNVTRDYLGLVAENSNIWQSAYYQDPSSSSGLLAAWIADEDLLGQSSSAWSFVENAVRTGEVKVTPWFKSGAAYLSALRNLLVKDGYQPA
jgi:hypothetical protein